MWYKLIGKDPVKCDLSDACRQPHVLYQTELFIDDTGVLISTVFLSLDHSHYSEGPPILFETMIFGGEHDGYQCRYCTYNEAEQNHLKIIEILTGSSKDELL